MGFAVIGVDRHLIKLLNFEAYCQLQLIYRQSELPMSTPLQLKRKTPQLLSTLDRTIHSKVTLAQIAPIFSPAKTVKMAHTAPAYSIRRPRASVSEESTTDLEEQVSQIMERDEEKSQFRGYAGVRNKRYEDVDANMKIGMGGVWNIPEKVKMLHEEQSIKIDGPPSFSQGCLADVAIYYFAVQNFVLFYDIGRAARSSRSLESCLLHELEFEDRVFQIKQISWAPPTMIFHQQRTLLLISTPWQLQFATLERSQSRPNQPVESVHWAKITMMPYYFTLPTIKVSFITEGNRQIFYVDEAGRVVRLSFEANDMLGKIFNGNKFKCHSEMSRNKISKNYFHTHRRATILDKIKHYSKVIITGAKSYFKSQPQIFGLAYNHRKQLLFSLIDLFPDRINLTHEYSYSKMLTCWKVEDGKLTLKSQVSQLQLLSSTQNQQIFSHNIGRNNKIAKIMPTKQSSYQKSCLLLILTNGIRLYVSLQDGIFQVDSFEYPPAFEPKKQNKQRKSHQYTKPVDMIHFYPEGHANIMTVKQDEVSHSFFIWKEHQLRQEENVCNWNWIQSMWRGSMGDSPAQSMLFKSSLGLLAMKKNQLLRSWQLDQKKRLLLNTRKINYLHSLARDVYCEPTLMINATDVYIEYFFIYRPIDLAFMAIEAQVFDSDFLCKILSKFDKKEVQGMLLQLLCDQQGVYVKDPEMVECMNNYTKTRHNLSLNLVDFSTHRADFFSQSKKLMSKKVHKRGCTVEQKLDLTSETKQKIHKLLLDLGNDANKSNREKDNYQKQISSVIECVVTYIARLTRYVWTHDVSDLTPQSYELINLLNSLLTTVDGIFKPQYLAKVRSDMLKSDILNHQKIKFFMSQEEIKQNRLNEQIAKMDEVIDKVKLFINKIIQLVLLGSQTKIHIKKKFYACLSMKPDAFEQAIFNELTLNHIDPLRSLNNYRTLFPLFIGPHLQKSLKVYKQTLNLDKSHTLKTLQAHSHVPQYLLGQIQIEKGLKYTEMAVLSRQEKRLKINNLSGSRDAIQELRSKMQQQHMDCGERQHVLLVLQSQLRLYLENRGGSKDNFYNTTSKETEQTSHIISMQKLLLDQYLRQSNFDPWILDNLRYTLMSVDSLKDVVEATSSIPLQIVFYYYFRPEDHDASKLFQQFFIECYESYESGKKKKGLIFGRGDKNNWNSMQSWLDLIVGKVRKGLNLQEFVRVLTESQDSARRQYFAESQKQWSVENTLEELLTFIKKDGRSQNGLIEWTKVHNYPIVSLILVESGIDRKTLESAYLEVMNRYIYSQKPISVSSLQQMYGIWLNLYCILLQYRGQFSEFVSKTKKMSNMKTNQHESMSHRCTNLMLELTSILRDLS